MEEYEALHALALKLLEDRFGQDSDARLLPGRMPTDLPIAVPVPSTTRIIGSWTRPGRAHILLETEIDAAAVDTFYREQFSAQGLRELKLGHPVIFHSPIGQEMRDDLGLSDRELEAFEGSDWARTTYRLGEDGPLVTIQAQEGQEHTDPTVIEIEVGADPMDWGLEDEPGNRSEDTEQIHRLLPVLDPPAGVQTWGGGENWGSDDAHVEASMLTDLSLQAVADHFNPQIAGRGWSEVESGVCGRVAWSQWERIEAGNGSVELLWFALRLPTRPPEYVLRLHAMKKEPRRPWNRVGGFGIVASPSVEKGEESDT